MAPDSLSAAVRLHSLSVFSRGRSPLFPEMMSDRAGASEYNSDTARFGSEATALARHLVLLRACPVLYCRHLPKFAHLRSCDKLTV